MPMLYNAIDACLNVHLATATLSLFSALALLFQCLFCLLHCIYLFYFESVQEVCLLVDQRFEHWYSETVFQ